MTEAGPLTGSGTGWCALLPEGGASSGPALKVTKWVGKSATRTLEFQEC